MSIQTFTRIIPKQKFEEWPEKLGRMSQLFQEAEYQMVKKKFRQAAIIQVDPNNLQAAMERINKDGLLFIPLKKMALSAGFSATYQAPAPGQPFYWQGCLIHTYRDGQRFKEADLKNDHRTIGRMLGYPDCCIDYFIRAFPIDPAPIWIDLEGKVIGLPECNGMLRYFGPKIVAHLSCSPTCQPTRKIGEIWFKVMQEIDGDLANELYKLLSGSITWNSYHGVVQVETPYFVGLNDALFLFKKPRIIIWKGKREEKKIKEKTFPKGKKTEKSRQ